MKYYIIAGEASGEMHGANLMKALKEQDPAAEFRFWGGDQMQEQGGEMVRHIRDTAFMGVAEVVKNMGKVRANIRLCKKDIVEQKPDVLILIDYAGFNLRIARFIKEEFDHLPVYYYISPKFWAWRESRVERVKKYVDKMFLIFPFEQEFYKRHDFKADYVGNPLLDNINAKKDSFANLSDFTRSEHLTDQAIIAILPGSRRQEIETILPYQLSVAKRFPNYQFVIAASPVFPKEFYGRFISDSNVNLVYNRTYEVLHHAEAALVTSGTATLETAILNTPQVVCMKANWITFKLAKMLVKVDYISLVNLILDKEVVRELVQADLTEEKLSDELTTIIEGGQKRGSQLSNYSKMREMLGGAGASNKAAQKMVSYLGKTK